ncbi:MAG: hypothetical protein JW940_35930 [Polyangiaceae bacterium]|nr:hypothetical protein [Polyangiaceae bacterium]
MTDYFDEIESAVEDEPSPTQGLLGAVSSALQGDRKKAKDAIVAARGRIAQQARTDLGQALRQLGALGGTESSPGPSRAARMAAPSRLPPLSPAQRFSSRSPSDGPAGPGASASRDDLAALRRISARNDRRAYEAIRQNARAIEQLARSQRTLLKQVAELQKRGDLAVTQRVVEGLATLERRAETAQRAQARALAARDRSIRELRSSQTRTLRSARLQARAARIDKLNSVAGSMQVGAFGAKGDLFATNNLLVAGNQLLWSFAGDLLRTIGLSDPGSSSPLGWLAPLASLATSQVALGNRQHERFIAGVATGFAWVDKTSKIAARVSLRPFIGSADWDAFRKRTDIVATATLLEPVSLGKGTGPVRTVVSDGVLLIELAPVGEIGPDAYRVAWLVDTAKPGG